MIFVHPPAGRAFVYQALAEAKSWPFGLQSLMRSVFLWGGDGFGKAIFLEFLMREKKEEVNFYSVKLMSFEDLLSAERTDLVRSELAKRLVDELGEVFARYEAVFGAQAFDEITKNLGSLRS